jgi:hypothetical protein
MTAFLVSYLLREDEHHHLYTHAFRRDERFPTTVMSLFPYSITFTVSHRFLRFGHFCFLTNFFFRFGVLPSVW